VQGKRSKQPADKEMKLSSIGTERSKEKRVRSFVLDSQNKSVVVETMKLTEDSRV